MKVYGKTNIFSGNISSNVAEESDKAQNILATDKLSEFDISGLDSEVSIIDKDTHSLTTFNPNESRWDDTIDTGEPDDTVFVRDINIRLKSMRHFAASAIDSHLSIDKTLFDFGPIGSPEDFVIDFLIYKPDVDTFGTLLYNGQYTGQVDLEQNKNFLLTTSGTTLVKVPNYQDDPNVSHNSADNGYVVCRRPYLKSNIKLDAYSNYHIAIIRSGDTTYLAINGEINDSAPSVEYFSYDDVKFGTGYYNSGQVTNIMSRLRVTKGTDRGWNKNFTPPDYEDTDGCDFVLHDTNLEDMMGNYTLSSGGTTHSIVNNICCTEYIYDKYRKTIVNLTNTDFAAVAPNAAVPVSLVLSNNENLREVEINHTSDIDYISIQSSNEKGYINPNIPGYLNTPSAMYQCADVLELFKFKNHWVQSNGHVSRPMTPHIARRITMPGYDSSANDSNHYKAPMVLDATALNNKTTTGYTFVNQDILPKSDIHAVSLSGSVPIYQAADSQYQDCRIDMILRFTANPTSNRSWAYCYNPGVGWAWNVITTTRQLEFSLGQYGGNQTAVRRSAYTASLPLNEWCFVSIRFDCSAPANTTSASIYSYIRSLETDVVHQNNVRIGSWTFSAGGYWYRYYYYNRTYKLYMGYAYSRGITQFNSGNPIDLLAYRRDGNSGYPTRNSGFESIEDFMNI